MKTALFRESGTIAQSAHKHKQDCARPTDMTDFDKESEVNPETKSRTNTEPNPQHEPEFRTMTEPGTKTRANRELEPETDEHIDMTKLEPKTEDEPMTDSGPLTRAEDKSKASTQPEPRATEHDSRDNSETETTITVQPEPMLNSKKISGPKAGQELQTEKDEKDLQEGNLYLTSLKY